MKNSMNKSLGVGKNLANIKCLKKARVAEAQGARGGLAWTTFYSTF